MTLSNIAAIIYDSGSSKCLAHHCTTSNAASIDCWHATLRECMCTDNGCLAEYMCKLMHVLYT